MPSRESAGYVRGPGTCLPAPRLCLNARRSLGSRLLSDESWRWIAAALGLSGRQLQVVRAMFDDETEFAIACRLRISPKTVHTHIERTYRKLGATDRVQVIVLVVENFLAFDGHRRAEARMDRVLLHRDATDPGVRTVGRFVAGKSAP